MEEYFKSRKKLSEYYGDRMSQSRVQNSMRNVVVGVITQILLMIISLVSRTVFIKVLFIRFIKIF